MKENSERLVLPLFVCVSDFNFPVAFSMTGNYLKKSREMLLAMSSRVISFAFPVAMTSKVFR